MELLKKLKILVDIKAYRNLNALSKGYRLPILKLTIIDIVNAQLSVAVALITKLMIDYAISKNSSLAIRYGVIFLLLLIIGLILRSYRSYYGVRIKNDMINEFQLNLLSSIYKKQYLELNQYKTGSLLTRLYKDIEGIVRSLTEIIPTIIALVLQLIVAFTMLAYFDLFLAMITFLVTPITILFSMIIGRKLKKIQHEIQEADGEQRSKIYESLLNIIIIKTFRIMQKNIDLISSLQKTKLKLILRKNAIGIKANVLLDFGYTLGFFCALAFGAYRISAGAITFGTFTAFLQLVEEIQTPIHEMSESLPQLISSFSSNERLEAIEALRNEQQVELEIDSNNVPVKLILDNVSFSYKDNITILDEVSLIINRGDKISIAGSSGEGKTTILNILLALIEPSTGEANAVYSNNITVPISPSTRKHFSYVSQSNTLFSGTILDNMLLGNDSMQEDIDKSLNTACAMDFIEQLEDGIHTNILERGQDLSQGQSQRLCIARALVQNPSYLILDEATSALDNTTEQRFIDNLILNYPELTLIAVTHRDGILQICNHHYTLSNKKIVHN